MVREREIERVKAERQQGNRVQREGDTEKESILFAEG